LTLIISVTSSTCACVCCIRLCEAISCGLGWSALSPVAPPIPDSPPSDGFPFDDLFSHKKASHE
jgi:hypothetical protein